MATKTIRKIVKIDEEKCDGCGVCIPSCVEGALKIIDGKARLVSEVYCDGLGACLGKCPQDAITVEEREAEEFDEKAVEYYHELKISDEDKLACGCPSATVTQFSDAGTATQEDVEPGAQPSLLRHWPVQLTLAPVKAPFLQDADVLLAADCVPFAYGGFHRDFIKDHTVLVACPKLDDFEAHLDKLTRIIAESGLKSLTVVHMEVPCCSGLVAMARKAIENSGKNIPLQEITIGVRGDIK